MHELGIAASICEVAEKARTDRQGGELVRVKVAIGELAAVDRDLLLYAWEALCAGNGSRCHLEIKWCPAQQFCVNCQQEKDRSEGSWLRVCPDCGFPLQVEGGRELDVVEVEMEES